MKNILVILFIFVMSSNVQAGFIGCDVGDVTLNLTDGSNVNSMYCENIDGNDNNIPYDWSLIDKIEDIEGYSGDWLFTDYVLDDPFMIVLKSTNLSASYFFDFPDNTSSGTYIVDGLFDEKLQDISHISLYVTEDINEVPLPASAWLLGTGLIGLLGFRKRKNS